MRAGSERAVLAARLGSIDERYEAFADANEVASGPLADDEKAAMIAELDAVVAHLYGLAREELEEMFEDFPQRRQASRRGAGPPPWSGTTDGRR